MMTPFSQDFALRLVQGLIVNFQIALTALILGLLLGALLAGLHQMRLPLIRHAIEAVMSVLRAVPVYIAMFFVAGVLRPYYAAIEEVYADAGVAFVILACLPYIAAYAYDQVNDALVQWRRGAHRAALLLIPNMARAFQVLVSASCFGAAIGVNEAMTVVLAEAEILGNSPWLYVLFALTIAIFVGLMQIIVASSRWAHRIIDRKHTAPV